MPLVDAFEATFIPIGLRACAISPLLNAALYLIMVGARLAPEMLGRVIKPYHREYEGHGRDRHWGKMFLESHAIIVFVLEP
jgi:hypothetical protein